MVTKTYFKTKDYVKVKFTVDAENASSVKIFGLNNDWNTPVELSKKKTGEFSAEVSLPKGTEQQFKYQVDGESWINDTSADSQAPDSFGGTNSVISL